MKPSEYFREAIRNKIPQIKGSYWTGVYHNDDAKKSGVCAEGLLRLLISRVSNSSEWHQLPWSKQDEANMVIREAAGVLGEDLVTLNDDKNWTWETFAEELEASGH